IRYFLRGAVFEQLARIAVIVLHHVAPVGLGRVRTCAVVRDRDKRAIEGAILERTQEILLVEIVGDLAVDQVDELVALPKIIDRDNLVFAPVAQRLDDIRTDEPGRAGDYDIHFAAPVSARRMSLPSA